MLAVPYVTFKVRMDDKVVGSYAMDCYFTRFLQHPARMTTLIKKEDSQVFGNPKSDDLKLDVLIKPNDVEDLLKDVYVDLETQLTGTRMDRFNHMRKWNLFRMLIPTGHYVHIKKDEELARKERESQMALAILSKVLGVKKADDLDSVTVVPNKIVYYRLDLKEGMERSGRRKNKDEFGTVVNEMGQRDIIYTDLLNMDELFREEFLRLLGKKNQER